MNLIYDRTRADVERAGALGARGWGALSEAERAEWLAGLKGAYNATDLNRVSTAVSYLAQWFAESGIMVTVSPREWGREDIPTPEDLSQYLADLRALRGALTVLPTTPQVPPRVAKTEAGPGLDWSGANDIERLLADLEDALERMALSCWGSGEIGSGEQ